MSSNLTREALRGPGSPLAEHRSRPLSRIDPIALGQAGLQALALAGTAILARYAHVEEGVEGMSELAATLPHPEWNILERALGAFTDPVREGPDGPADDTAEERARADALVAMCLRARTVLARQHPDGSPLVRTGARDATG